MTIKILAEIETVTETGDPEMTDTAAHGIPPIHLGMTGTEIGIANLVEAVEMINLQS